MGHPVTRLQYVFGPGFERRVIKLSMSDPSLVLSGLVRPEYFQNPILQYLIRVLSKYQREYKKGIDHDEMVVLVQHNPDGLYSGSVLEELAEIQTLKLSAFIRDRIAEFSKKAAARLFLEQAIEAFKQGQIERIFDGVEQARSAGVVLRGEVYDYLGDFAKRVERLQAVNVDYRTSPVSPTGVESLDHRLSERGLQPGEMGLILAATNQGKSGFLVSIGRVNLSYGKKVLHISIGDLSAKAVGRRYDSSILNLSQQEMEGMDKEPMELELRRFFEQSKGALEILFYPARRLTPSELFEVAKQKKPDVLILDYGMLMIPDEKAVGEGSDRRDLETIHLAIYNIARDLNIPIWTAYQSQKETLREDRVPGPTDTGECYAVAKHAPLIIGIKQNENEKLQKLLWVQLSKNREQESGFLMQAKADWRRMRIWDPEAVGEQP